MRRPVYHRHRTVLRGDVRLDGRARRPRVAPAAERQRGIALVVVLWLVVVITVIGASHARNTRIETTLAFNQIGSAQARALAEAGINRAIMELFASDTATRWPLDGTAYPLQLDSGSVIGRDQSGQALLQLFDGGP